MTPLLLGLDVGTTLTKGILIDPEGGVVAEAGREATLHSERPGWAEEDPRQWWENACAVTRELLERAAAPPEAVRGVGVSGMVPAMVLLDAGGAPLRRSLQQNDARSGLEVSELRAEADTAAFFAATGGSINQQVVAPKARWLARHEPGVWSRLATLMGSYDYLAYRLTGVPGVERNWALESGLYDVDARTFAPWLVRLAGLEPRQLPPIHDAHEVVGRVTAEAAAATGLMEGTPVVAGAADHVASAYATTATEPGDLVVKYGGAGDILYSSDQRVSDPRLFLDLHVLPDKWYLNGCMATSGSLLRWWVDGFCHPEKERARLERRSVYALLDEAAGALPAGADGLVVLPYFLGEKTPLHDPDARGTVIGLDLHHTRTHVFRAVLEAVAYGFRHHVDVLRERDLPIRRVLAADGGARSDLWLQITADVLGMEVQRVAKHPGSSLGAAIAAGIGTGLLDDWGAVTRYVSMGRSFAPDPHHRGVYDRLYHVYRESYRRLRDLYPSLHGAAEPRVEGPA